MWCGDVRLFEALNGARQWQYRGRRRARIGWKLRDKSVGDGGDGIMEV